MKNIFITLTALLLMTAMPSKAGSYDDISEYALFLTDKMAYELNLSEEQYEAAYEINFDYLCEVLRYGDLDDYDDLYGRAWELRNRDLRIVLMSSQFRTYQRLKYFYRPFSHSHGRITIRIYDYYPRRDYLFFGCPHFVVTYRGGHGWRHYHRHSYYAGRAWNHSNCYGMRDGYRNGHRYYHNTTHHGIHHGRRIDRCEPRHDRECHDHGFRSTGSRGRISSTRTTVNNSSSGFSGSRSNISRNRRLPDNKFTPREVRRNDNSSRNVSRSTRNNSSSRNNSSKTNGSDTRRTGFGGGR